MNYRKMLKQILKLNFEQYYSYIFCLILSVVFFFIELSLYNSFTAAIIPHDIFVFPSIAVFNTALWGTFIYISFMKYRQKEFITFLALGMTCNELKLLLLIENALIFIIYIPIGLTLGLIFSKIIVLFIFKLAGIYTFNFQIKRIVYIVTFGYSVLLTAIFFLWTYKFIDSLSSSNISTQRNSVAVNSLKKRLFKITVYILAICYIHLSERIIIASHFKYYVDYSSACMLIIYISILAFIKGFIAVIRKYKNFYYKKILLINELKDSLEDNKITIFFIAFLNFTFIITNRIYDLPNVKTFFSIYNFFRSSSFNLVYIFIVLLSFITSANILYFKTKVDIYNWQWEKNKLYNIGLIDEEINTLLIYKLRLIFFSQFFLVTLASILYINILNINKEFTINTVKILICYFTIQLLGYIIAKHKLNLNSD